MVSKVNSPGNLGGKHSLESIKFSVLFALVQCTKECLKSQRVKKIIKFFVSGGSVPGQIRSRRRHRDGNTSWTRFETPTL